MLTHIFPKAMIFLNSLYLEGFLTTLKRQRDNSPGSNILNIPWYCKLFNFLKQIATAELIWKHANPLVLIPPELLTQKSYTDQVI